MEDHTKKHTHDDDEEIMEKRLSNDYNRSN